MKRALTLHIPDSFHQRGFAQQEHPLGSGTERYLEQKAAAGCSFSLVDHLRWDLRAIFRLAAQDAGGAGAIENPNP